MKRAPLINRHAPRAAQRAGFWKTLALSTLAFANGLCTATAWAECEFCENSEQKTCSACEQAVDEKDLPPVIAGPPSWELMKEGETGEILGATSLADSVATMPHAGVGSSAALASLGGLIDSAVIRTRMQFRYDNVTGIQSDRAEYLFGALNSTVPSAVGGGGSTGNGTILGPNRVVIQDYEYNEFSNFFEYAIHPRLSGFVELPFRQNDIQGLNLRGGDLSGSGLADLNAGLRLGLITECDRHTTFQLKFIAPSGEAAEALGTGHAAIQPGLLFQRDYDRFRLFGEVHDWIGLDGTTFAAQNATNPLNGRRYAGNVLRYGLGAAYAVTQNPCKDRQLFLVGEVVGWTVIDGLRTEVNGISNNVANYTVHDANGDTIVNSNMGLRYTTGHHSFYVGYSFPVTGNEWYSDMFRVEYQLNTW
jgi:hypothetical protein